jgi:hypothetical protein
MLQLYEGPRQAEGGPDSNGPAGAGACADAGAGRRVCGARRRNGEPCRRLLLAGRTRCRLHGGATPGGVASPHFRLPLLGSCPVSARQQSRDVFPYITDAVQAHFTG